MLLISPNFDVKFIIFFPILARGLFPKLQEKALIFKTALSNRVQVFEELVTE